MENAIVLIKLRVVATTAAFATTINNKHVSYSFTVAHPTSENHILNLF